MPNITVFQGIWTNWEGTGPSLTLTLSQAQGTILIAFLTLLVTVAGRHLWSIICFTLHQIRSTPSERDGLHHQQQALLANAPSSASTALTLLNLGWKWKRSSRTLWPLSLIGGTALLHQLGIFAASLLVASRLQIDGDIVLAKPSHCGMMISEGGGDANSRLERLDGLNADEGSLAMLHGRMVANEYLDYARRCYRKAKVEDQTCTRYAVPSIPSTTRNVSCPFAAEMCAIPRGFQVDTGMVDSNDHLGINLPPENRVRFRKVLTCVPTLAEERYATGWVERPLEFMKAYALEGDRFRYYDLGRSSESEYTWWISNYTVWGSWPGYYLKAATAWSSYWDSLSISDFIPIPALRVPQSDISLLFLHSKLLYLAPVHDPWFRATSHADTTGTNLPVPPNFTRSDRIYSVLGCTEQYQFCVGDGSAAGCSSLGGIYANDSTPWYGLSLDDDQKAAVQLIYQAAFGTAIHWASLFLGEDMLLARRSVWGRNMMMSAPLSENQWEAEVENIANIMLATLQQRVVSYASPPHMSIPTGNGSTISTHPFVKPMDLPGADNLCRRIRVRNAAYQNFDIFYLGVVLVLCSCVIGANLVCVPGLAFWIQRKMGREKHGFGRREWIEGHLFRLQRGLLEGKDVGPWSAGGDGEDLIPVSIEKGLAFPAEFMWEEGRKKDLDELRRIQARVDTLANAGGVAQEGRRMRRELAEGELGETSSMLRDVTTQAVSVGPMK